ncbi:MAG: hypothetical protein ACXAC8_08230 [Candidatus Hodarchaeales archaeon]
MKEFEIKFKLHSTDRSELFQFMVNPISQMQREFPSFPKEKFLRALSSYSDEKKYSLFSGNITNLKFKHTTEFDETQEIHVLILVFEKIGPISLIFRKSFEFLVLEGVDAQYNYLGSEALLNVLIQIIKPESPTVKGLGKITTIYHASNLVELTKKEKLVPLMNTIEGQVLIFSLSIIIPTIVLIILPIQVLDTTIGYIISLIILAELWCLYPIAKKSIRHAPIALVSVLTSYLFFETLIHVGVLLEGGINPWGIFNNISRQNLIGILRNQDIFAELGRGVFLGMDILQIAVPFIDAIIISFIPFTIGVGIAGLLEKFDFKWKLRFVVKVLLTTLLVISTLVVPLGYHALGKGTEGTLHASIGLLETADMFSSAYIQNLEANLDQLFELIESAQQHLWKANNSFDQFGQNPLIAFVLPYLLPQVAGIPLEDLPEILTLTGVLADTVQYFPSILWAYYNLQEGFNQSFDILQQSLPFEGIGAQTIQDYDLSMLRSLGILQQGINNLSLVEQPLINLIEKVQTTLDYSVFADISNLLNEIEIGLPILVTVVSAAIPWINSTYKLTLVLDEINKFNFTSEILFDAEKDFNISSMINTIDLEALPEDAVIPIRDLVKFSLNLHNITEQMMFSVHNATSMFHSLNGTLNLIQDINFSYSENIHEPLWLDIEVGLQNTSNYLEKTQTSIDMMNLIIESQDTLLFEEVAGLNQLLEDLGSFTESTSERFNVISDYFHSLNGTYHAIRFSSLGTNMLNKTLSLALNNNSFSSEFNQSADQAEANFTLCQVIALNTSNVLGNISNHLLNESGIANWQGLLIGNITDSATNSIYMNAQACLDLIANLWTVGTYPERVAIANDFLTVLNRMESLNWNIFTFSTL